MGETSIEWTDAVWNCVVGCSRVSKGCERCFAERVAHRGMSAEHRGLTVLGKHGPRWTGEVRFLPDRLATPLGWKRPRRIFVNSMSDLFHEALAFDDIAAIFGVMAATPQHTFQVLTKRPERARAFFDWILRQDTPSATMPSTLGLTHAVWCALRAEAQHHPDGDSGPLHTNHCADIDGPWPLPHVWLGVSVEDQATADARIPHLLACPAAVRFVSYEPASDGIHDVADVMPTMRPAKPPRDWRPPERDREGTWFACVRGKLVPILPEELDQRQYDAEGYLVVGSRRVGFVLMTVRAETKLAKSDEAAAHAIDGLTRAERAAYEAALAAHEAKAERDTLAAALAEARGRAVSVASSLAEVEVGGHEGDEDSGAHDEDCQACAIEATQAATGALCEVLAALPADLAAARFRRERAEALEAAADVAVAGTFAPLPGALVWRDWLRARAADERGGR